MRVAVLGAGLTGSLVALELASSGKHVTLYDRLKEPISGASLASEGKIHLGYVYALDHSRKTATTMIRGAASFQPLIERWTGRQVFEDNISEPFLYAVPKDSLLSADAIRKHFRDVADGVGSLTTSEPNAFIDPRWNEMHRKEVATIFDTDQVVTAFRTQERAIDTFALAAALRSALSTLPRLETKLQTQITSVSEVPSGICVAGATEGANFSSVFDVVVNALWQDRVYIDSTLGLPVERPLFHRFKYGMYTRDERAIRCMPNVTFLIGPYGDSVTFPDNAYISWYPIGLVSEETGIRPSTRDFLLSDARRLQIIEGTIQNFRRLMPLGGQHLSEDPEKWKLMGGFITAWGQTGINDFGSELHRRYDVGVLSKGNYHSIDTGKLTTAPMFAAQACAKINGSETVK